MNRGASVSSGAADGRRSPRNLFIFYWNSTNIYPVHSAHQLLICRLRINSAEIHQETAELINRLGLKDLQLWGLLIYQKRQTIEKSPLPHTRSPPARRHYVFISTKWIDSRAYSVKSTCHSEPKQCLEIGAAGKYNECTKTNTTHPHPTPRPPQKLIKSAINKSNDCEAPRVAPHNAGCAFIKLDAKKKKKVTFRSHAG